MSKNGNLENLFEQFDNLFVQYRLMREDIQAQMTSIVDEILTLVEDPRANNLSKETIEELKNIVESIRTDYKQNKRREDSVGFTSIHINRNKHTPDKPYGI